MARRWIHNLGMVASSLFITVIAILASETIYFLTIPLLGPPTARGILTSLLIPAIVTPPIAFFFLRVFSMLERSEHALLQSEEKHSTVLANIEDGYYEVDLAGNLVYFNDSLCRILGYAPEALKGVNFREFMDAPNAEKVFKTFNRVFKTGRPSKGFDWEIIKPDGSRRSLDTSVSPITDVDGRQTGFRGIARDRTERIATEKALQDNIAKYRQLLDHAPAGIYEIDFAKGKMVNVNDVMCYYTGYSREELLSMSIYELLGTESKEIFTKRLEKLFNGETIPETVDYTILTKDGTPLDVQLNIRYFSEGGHTTGATVVVRDITAQKAAEREKAQLAEQLRQAQKMEAIGTLAGGIAHDFNNVLSGILGYTEITLLKVPKNSPIRTNLNKIVTSCQRARDMVSQIMAFSRQTKPERKPINIGRLIGETLKMLSASLPAEIVIQPRLDTDTAIIEADAVQIQQVLINLCTNAAHAMKKTGGKLNVTLQPLQVKAQTASKYPGIAPGAYFKLTVSDTGQGIDAETMNRIFDPYFTTKAKGEGTGLGLSIVQNIVHAHKGAIFAESPRGSGAAFHVLLPAKMHDKAIEGNKKSPASPPTGSEHILLIDDEPTLVEVGKQILSHLGYHVTTLTQPEDALSLFREHPNQFDLVITDMSMPGITGDRLAREMIAIRPDLPIILCTGYNQTVSEENIAGLGIRAVIMKPYLANDMAIQIRRVLDGRRKAQTA